MAIANTRALTDALDKMGFEWVYGNVPTFSGSARSAQGIVINFRNQDKTNLAIVREQKRDQLSDLAEKTGHEFNRSIAKAWFVPLTDEDQLRRNRKSIKYRGLEINLPIPGVEESFSVPAMRGEFMSLQQAKKSIDLMWEEYEKYEESNGVDEQPESFDEWLSGYETESYDHIGRKAVANELIKLAKEIISEMTDAYQDKNAVIFPMGEFDKNEDVILKKLKTLGAKAYDNGSRIRCQFSTAALAQKFIIWYRGL
jgi:hypothetical protein